MVASQPRPARDARRRRRSHRSHPQGRRHRSHRPRRRLRRHHQRRPGTRGRVDVSGAHRGAAAPRLQRRRRQEDPRPEHPARDARGREGVDAAPEGTRGVAAPLHASNAMAERIRIVALGDSTTAGTPGFLSPLEAPPGGKGDVTSQYAHWLMKSEPNWDVINCGVNGERSDQIAARVVRDVIGASPAAVVIIAGVNDVYQGRTVEHVLAQLRTMYDRAAACRDPRRRRHNRSLQHGRHQPRTSACARSTPGSASRRAVEPAIAFVDTRAAVARPGNADRLAESPDGLHPSPRGYRADGRRHPPCAPGSLARYPVGKPPDRTVQNHGLSNASLAAAGTRRWRLCPDPSLGADRRPDSREHADRPALRDRDGRAPGGWSRISPKKTSRSTTTASCRS